MMVIIITEKDKICILINVATPSDRKLIQKIAEKTEI
jgi:hypothetical protein